MLKEINLVCPVCKRDTVLAVSSPQPGVPSDARATITSCRQCPQKFMASTSADGVVRLFLFPFPDETPQVVATLHSAFGLADIVHVPFAIWQPRGDAVDEFRHRADWSSALGDALVSAQARPRPLSVPRRIFLSYRWRSAADDAWVHALFRELRARGNEVIFDHDVAARAHPPTVTELVARIADCHVFLAILDADYIERVAGTEPDESREGWVTDEFHTALAFARQGTLNLLGFVREGDKLPPGFRSFQVGKAGNTFDVRDEGALRPILDQFFVQFGTAPSADEAALAEVALHESRQAAERGDTVSAYEAADRACQWIPELADGFAQRARTAYASGRREQTIQDALHALEIDPTREEMLLFGAAAACNSGDWRLAARLGRTALERNRRNRDAHHLVGSALLELEQVHAALAHFEIARRLGVKEPQLFNAAGQAWRRLARPVEALRWCEAGIEAAGFQTSLVGNAAAAAIEAGLPTKAWNMLEHLLASDPPHEDLKLLASALATLCQQDDDKPLPVLAVRLDQRATDSRVTCTACEAQIPLNVASEGLCFGCGSPRPLRGQRRCLACESDGIVVPSLDSKCPLCGEGNLILSTSA